LTTLAHNFAHPYAKKRVFQRIKKKHNSKADTTLVKLWNNNVKRNVVKSNLTAIKLNETIIVLNVTLRKSKAIYRSLISILLLLLFRTICMPLRHASPIIMRGRLRKHEYADLHQLLRTRKKLTFNIIRKSDEHF